MIIIKNKTCLKIVIMYIMIYTCTYFRYLYNEVSNWIQMTNHIVKQGDSLYMLIRKPLLFGMNKKYQVLSSGLWKDTKWYCAVNQFCCMYQKKKITVDVNTWICDIFIGSLVISVKVILSYSKCSNFISLWLKRHIHVWGTWHMQSMLDTKSKQLHRQCDFIGPPKL